MATAMAAKSAPDFIFEWEGKDRTGKTLVPGGLGADTRRLLVQPMARVPGRTLR